jgi:phage major head subunit gpT-like protein
MTILRANFGNLLYPGLRAVFFNEFSRWTAEYPQYMNVLTSKRKYEEDQLITGLGVMPQKNEGAAVIYEDISQGYKTTYTHLTYAHAIRVTQEMYEDDLYRIMSDLTGALARAAQQRKEVLCADILNNAFANAFAGTDGVSLINTVHPLSIGGTQNNLVTAADLSAASLQDGIETLETCRDEKGLNLAIRAKLLIVPPQEQWTAYELLKSEYKPGTSDNELNAILGKSLKFMVNHYLTDTDAWFLLGEGHKLNLFERAPISFNKGNDFDTQDAKFLARMRLSAGWSDWRAVTGSAGV